MFDVILVDDEIASIRYLRQIIANYLPAFRVVGEFENGQDALLFLQKHPVDLLITDVRMPMMDGIALAKEARRLFAGIHMVIVSGHADFAYAKGAIEASVDDYLLKPLNITMALDVLSTVEAKLAQKQSLAKRAALIGLITSNQPNMPLLKKHFGDTPLYLAVVRFGNLPLKRDAREFSPPDDMQGDACRNTWVLRGRDSAERIVISQEMLGDGERLCAAAGRNDSTQHYTCVQRIEPSSVADVRRHVEEMAHYMDEKHIIGRSAVYQVPPYEPTDYTVFSKSELLKIDTAMASGSDRRIRETLLAWAVAWEKQGVSQRWVERAIDIIVQRSLEFMQHRAVNHLQVYAEINELYTYIGSIGDLMLGVWDVVFEPHIQPKMSRQESQKVFSQISEFIHENYRETITIQSVCSLFGVSQTYLSRLFRKHGDTTFNEYLTHCRMEKAKELILRQTDMKLGDIAALVGYDDASYFSRVFRLSVGMTPTQFAAAHRV